MWNSHINFIINESEFQIITFTIFQAFLSALISVFLAIPLAKAIFRNNFPGKVLLINVMNIIFILPVLVVVLTVIKIFGFNGLPNQILDLLGLQKISIYGIQGILLGHVLINLPFAVRLLLSGWSNIALEHFRLARQLNFGGKEYFKYLEKPMLKKNRPRNFFNYFPILLFDFFYSSDTRGGTFSYNY
jgi:thiamine transport system permease protein